METEVTMPALPTTTRSDVWNLILSIVAVGGFSIAFAWLASL